MPAMNVPAPVISTALHFKSALLPDGWGREVRVEIADGRFGKVSRDTAPQAGDERWEVGLPGMPNVHSHGFQRGMAGLTEYRGADADNFWSWRELMYRFVQRMTPDDLQAVTAMAFLEMLETGFTRVGEFHYVHHDPAGKPYADPAEMMTRVAAAAVESGIALTLLPVFYAHGNFGGRPPTEGQRRFISDVPGFARLLESGQRIARSLPDANCGIAPHSLRAVTPEQLASLTALAPAGPIHIHAAEQVKEVDDCLAWSGARPVQWLLDHAAVDSRWCLVHATHMTPDEVRRLAQSGAVAGFCPVTEANLGDGIAPAQPFLGAGGAFGIGTDSNVSIGASEELRQLEYSQRLRDRARNVLVSDHSRSTGQTLYANAVHGGTQALGLQPAGISVGAPADCLALAADAAALACRGEASLLDSFIFVAGANCIDTVWRGGRKLVSQGKHHARAKIEAQYVAALKRIIL